MPSMAGRRVVIVGARAASGKACQAAREMAQILSDAGTTVLSGGALGIDAAAHAGALAGRTPTYAVLGCGVDVVYPDRHAALFARIQATGGLLSEFSPGTPARARQFPSRNRILAALGEAVIVVEAALRSGSLSTAKVALEMGIPLFAMPGSPGTDALLSKGFARCLACQGDILAVLAGAPVETGGWEPSQVSSPMGHLLAALVGTADTPEGIAARIGQPLPVVLALLSEAQLDGLVRRADGNHYEVMGRASS